MRTLLQGCPIGRPCYFVIATERSAGSNLRWMLMGQGLLTCPIQLSGQWRPAVMPRARSETGAIYALCTDGFVPRHDNHFVIATERSVGSNLRWMLMGQGLLACPIQLSGQWRPAVTSRARSLTECPAGMRPARSFGYFVIATEPAQEAIRAGLTTPTSTNSSFVSQAQMTSFLAMTARL